MAKKKITVIINEDIHATVKKLAVDKNKKISELYEEHIYHCSLWV